MLFPRPSVALLLSAVLLGALPAANARADALADANAALEREDYTAAQVAFSRAAADRPALKNDPAFVAKQKKARAGACCEAAERLIKNGSGAMALAQLDEAEQLAPGWDRPAKLRAKVTHVAGDEAWTRAVSAAGRGDAKLANAELANALTHNPDHAQAKAMQTALKAGAPAGSEWAVAEKAAGAHDWQAAEAAWGRVLKAQPQHLPALIGTYQALGTMATQTAAVNQARLLLAEGRLDEALAKVNAAVQAWPKAPGGAALAEGAKARRAQTDAHLQAATEALARHDAAAAVAAFRAALALDTQSVLGKNGLVEALGAQADALGAAGRPGAAVALLWPERTRSPKLEARVTRGLAGLRQAHTPKLKVVGGDANLPGLAAAIQAGWPDGASGPEWTLNVAVNKLERDVQRSASEDKVWTWQSTREVPNPEYDQAVAKLVRARQGLSLAQENLNTHRGNPTHSPGCDCADCCGQQAALMQLRMWQNEVAEAQALLNRTPRMSVLFEPHQAGYTDETWTATGRLGLAFTTQAGETFGAESDYSRSDRKRLGARPEVGLPEDALELPSAAQMTGELLAAAALKAKPQVREKGLQARVVELRRAADAAAKDGQQDTALELRVAAAAVLGQLSDSAGAQALDACR